MSFQLIFTSSPRGLTLGRSGFCTVARHKEISESLVSALERWSAYERPEDGGTTLPIIHAYRILRLGASTFHVLTRIQDAGVDYTQRGNHLAQHLIFLPQELQETPTPADIFLKWDGWIDNWTETPRYLEDTERPALDSVFQKITLPAQTWRGVTGDAAHAALLAQPDLRGGVILTSSTLPPRQTLQLFGESLLLLEADESDIPASWSAPFTTCLQAHDEEEDFSWIAVESRNADEVQSRRSLPFLPLKNSSWPSASPELEKRAREGGAAVQKLKDTARLPDLSYPKAEAEIPQIESRRPSSSPRTVSPKSPATSTNPLLFIFSAVLLLMLILAGGWFLTRSSASSPTPSVSGEIAQLEAPGKREALRQFLRENPATTGDAANDASLQKATLWLEASDYLDQLQFLRRQEESAPLQEALLRVQNLPQLSDLKTALPQLTYEMAEAQTWLAKKTAPVPLPPTPEVQSPPVLPKSEAITLTHYFGSAPVLLTALSAEKSLSLSGLPEAVTWMENLERNPSRLVRILPLNELPLAGEGVSAKPSIRRNRSDPFRFYQGVHLLFESKALDGNDGASAFELTFSKDFETVTPQGTFGRVLQFEDTGGILFSIFILKQGVSEPLLRLPYSMTIEQDPVTSENRFRKDLYFDSKIALAPPATAAFFLHDEKKNPSTAVPLTSLSLWEKFHTPGPAKSLSMELYFPGEEEGKNWFSLISWEEAPAP